MKKRAVIAACLVSIVAVILAWYLSHGRGGAEPPLDSSGGTPGFAARIDGVPYFLQNDPAWGQEPIGGSNESMAAAGCTVTCVAMAMTSLGYETTPFDLCRGLKERSGFTDQGYLIWDRIEAITRGGIHVDFPALTHEEIESALAQGRPAIAKIMLGGRIPHWVLIVGKTGGEYLVHDPLNGGRTLLRLSERSGQIHAVRILKRV